MAIVHNSGLSRRWGAAWVVLPAAVLIAYLVLISIATTLGATDDLGPGPGVFYWVGMGVAAVAAILLVGFVLSSLSIKIGTGGVSRWTFGGWSTLTWADIRRAGRQGSGVVLEGDDRRLGFVPAAAFHEPAAVEKYIKRFLPASAESDL